MYDKDWKGISYTGGFFLLIALVIGGITAAGLIALPMMKTKPGLAQSLTFIIGFFIPTVITAAILHRRPFKLLGFVKGVKLNQAGLTILILGAAVLISASLAYFSHYLPIPADWKTKFTQWEADYNEQIAKVIQLRTVGDYLIALLVLGFAPAVCEETLFRGGMQNFLSRATRNPWVGIIIASILFSLAHTSFYLFLSRLFLGMTLGVLFYYSGNLWLSILAHFVNNAVTLTILFLSIRQGTSIQDAMQNETGSGWGIVALPLIIALLWLFRRVSPVNRHMA